MARATGSKKKRAGGIKNLDRLVDANVIDPKNLSASHKRAINKMSAAEVRALISVKKQLGDGPAWKPKSTKQGWVAAL